MIMELLKFRIDYEFYSVELSFFYWFLSRLNVITQSDITWQKYQCQLVLLCLDIELVSLGLDPVMISQF